MRKMVLGAMALATLSVPMVATPVMARHHHDDYDHNSRYYRGDHGRYYCKRSNGTTGTIVGAVGGGLAGNLLGGGTLGTLAGAGGGALLGRSIDRGKVHCR